MRILRNILIFLLFAGALTLLTVHYLKPEGSIKKLASQRESEANMQRLAAAVSEFSVRHRGGIPKRISKLFPEYIKESTVFYVLDPEHSNAAVPETNLDSPVSIDRYCPYTVLASTDGRRAIIFERTGLWKDSTIAWQKLARDDSQQGFLPAAAARSDPEEFARIIKEYLELSPQEL